MEEPLLETTPPAEHTRVDEETYKKNQKLMNCSLYFLLAVIFVLSRIFCKEYIPLQQSMLWETRAFGAVFLLLFSSMVSYKSPIMFFFIVYFVITYNANYVKPFMLGFWPWLTWPVQLLIKLIRGQSIAPVWRPILWGAAQYLKVMLPLLNCSGLVPQVRASLLASEGGCMVQCCTVFVVCNIILILSLPVGWIYTCPLAQIWLIYVRECGERMYFWARGNGEPPTSDVFLCAACTVAYFTISIWQMRTQQQHSVYAVLGIPMNTEDFLKGVMQKGGFKAKLEDSLERSNSRGAQLLRKASSILFTANDADLETKRKQLYEDCVKRHGGIIPQIYHLGPVERCNLLETSLKYLRKASTPQLLSKGFRVKFKDEPGIDCGGVTRDWYDSMGAALVDGSQGDLEQGQLDAFSALMVQATDQTLLPRPSGYTEEKLYAGSNHEVAAEAEAAPSAIKDRWLNLATVGRFIAVAVLKKFPLPLSFGNVLLKFLCDRTITYDDVRQLDPEFFKYRVAPILKKDGVQVMNSGLGEPLTFVSAATDHVKPLPLIPNGEAKEVTEENKEEYLAKLSEARLCNGRRRELTFFVEGFHEVIPLESIKGVGLTPNELSVLISGVQTYNVADWKRHARCSASDGSEVLEWFWEVLESFDEEKRAKVLQFSTGSSRLPPKGFEDMNPVFAVVVTGADVRHLPVSHTCANQLDLPKYASKEELEAKLLTALENSGSAGFGFA